MQVLGVSPYKSGSSPFDSIKNVAKPVTSNQMDVPRYHLLKNREYFNKKTVTIASSVIAAIGVISLFVLNRKNISKFFTRGASNISNIAAEFNRETPKPNYLYHITTKENYESMLREGIVRKSRISDGVFLSDIQNVKTKYQRENVESLINWYTGRNANWADGGPISPSGTMVVLELPLDKSPNELFKVRKIALFNQDNSQLDRSWSKVSDFSESEFREFSATPLEFLYCDEIPISSMKKIKEIPRNKLNQNDLAGSFFAKLVE